MNKIKFFFLTALLIIGFKSSIAQPVKVIGVTQPVTLSGHVLREMYTGLTDIKLKKAPAYTVSVTGTEIGTTGFYSFTGLTPGFYKLYINGTEKQEYGLVQIATFLDSLGVVKMGADFDVNTHKIINLSNASSGNDALNRNYADSRYLTLGVGNTNIVTDATIFHGTIQTITTPTTDDDIANKQYVDDQIAGIIVTPTQFGADIRRVISGGITVTGRDYTTVAGAYGSISSTDDQRYKVELITGSNDVTLGYDNLFYADHNDIDNYTSLIGTGLNTYLVLGMNSASTTKTGVTVENCTVFMGANDIAGNRTYNGWTFNNCTIYAYKSTTYNNCSMKECDVVNANTYTPTLSGSGKYTGCTFSQNATKTSFTGTTPGMNDGYDTNPTMPGDPSLAP